VEGAQSLPLLGVILGQVGEVGGEVVAAAADGAGDLAAVDGVGEAEAADPVADKALAAGVGEGTGPSGEGSSR